MFLFSRGIASQLASDILFVDIIMRTPSSTRTAPAGVLATRASSSSTTTCGKTFHRLPFPDHENTNVILNTDVSSGYLDESLGDALKAGHSGRHLARMAHLAISRGMVKAGSLEAAQDLSGIISKLFGDFNNKDDCGGWLWRSSFSGNKALLSPGGFCYKAKIKSNLQSTFNLKVYTSRRDVTAFRVVHFLMTEERGNLFSFLFEEGRRMQEQLLRGASSIRGGPAAQSLFYQFPVDRLPPCARESVNAWIASKTPSSSRQGHIIMGGRSPEGMLPPFFRSVVAIATGGGYVKPGFLPLSLQEYFIVRFVHWFVSERFSVGDATRAPRMNSGGLGSASSSNNASRVMPPSFSLHGVHVNDIARNCPPMELLQMYCETFLPPKQNLQHRIHHAQPNWPSSVMEGDLAARWGSFFLMAASEFWLTQHRKASTSSRTSGNAASSALSRGTASRLRRSAPAAASLGGADLNPMQLGGIVTLVSHLQFGLRDRCFYISEKLARLGPRQQQKALVDQLRAGTLGTTEYMRVLERPLYDFFSANMSSAPQVANYSAYLLEANMLGVMSAWICYLEPWHAGGRVQVKSSDEARSRPSAPFTPGASTHPQFHAESRTENAFSLDWVWFVVRNFAHYTQLLSLVLERLSNGTPSEGELLCIARAFQPHGAFGDGAFAVLLACESILENVAAAQQSRRGRMRQPAPIPIASSVGISWVRETAPGLKRSNSSGSLGSAPETPTQPSRRVAGSASALVSQILEYVEANRMVAVRMLSHVCQEHNLDVASYRASFSSNNFGDIPTAFLGAAGGVTKLESRRPAQRLRCERTTKRHAEEVLRKLVWKKSALEKWVVPSGARFEAPVPPAKQSAKATSPAASALNWFENSVNALGSIGSMMQGNSKTTAQKMQSKLIGDAIDRMHALFGISRIRKPTSSSRKDDIWRRMFSSANTAPDAESTTSVPPWVPDSIGASAYKRLSYIGRQQLINGTCDSKASLASTQGYIGDELKKPRPVCSYEVYSLVTIAIALSLKLNETLASAMGESSSPRFNLRFIADVRNLLAIILLSFFYNPSNFFSLVLLGVVLFSARAAAMQRPASNAVMLCYVAFRIWALIF